MSHIKPHELKEIKKIDLFTYLKNYQPDRLKKYHMIHTVFVIIKAFIFQMDYGIGNQQESVGTKCFRLLNQGR